MSSHPSFDAFLDGLRRGDDEAAAQLLHRFELRLFALARSRLDGQLAAKVGPEDVVQSVFRSFLRCQAEERFELGSWDSLRSLLTLLTVRKCRSWHRHYRAACRDVRREVALLGEANEAGPAWEALTRDPTPQEAALLTEAVQDLLQRLEGRDRPIVELALQGHTAAEISAQLGRPERAVYRVLGRVKQRLQQMPDADPPTP
jgi:RNA polymerase sigma-70 factor (ECF subfamily)